MVWHQIHASGYRYQLTWFFKNVNSGFDEKHQRYQLVNPWSWVECINFILLEWILRTTNTICMNINAHSHFVWINRCQILGTSKTFKKNSKKIYRDQNITTFLLLRVRSSSLESNQVCAETLESEHFQTLLRKSGRLRDHQNLLFLSKWLTKNQVFNDPP